MSDRQARGVERLLQDAEQRGEFTDLPGAGRPLPGLGSPAGEDWWLRQKTTRENIGDEALPATLRLRREVDDLPEVLDRLDDESAVRERIDELNVRIRAALIGPPDGPPLNFGVLDPEPFIAAWRRRT